MTSTTFFFVFIPLLAIILLAVNLIFAPHNPYQEKDSAFECGFHSFLGQNRTQFSISFFIFALLFLLFDLEILLVYPYVVSAYTNGIYGLVIMLIFFLALTLGFAFELGKNALKIESRQTIVKVNSNLTNNQLFVQSDLNNIKIKATLESNILGGLLHNLTYFKCKLGVKYFSTSTSYLVSPLNSNLPLDGNNAQEGNNSPSDSNNSQEGYNSPSDSNNSQEGYNSSSDSNYPQEDNNSPEDDGGYASDPNAEYFHEGADAMMYHPVNEIPEDHIREYINATGEVSRYPEEAAAEPGDSLHQEWMDRNAELRRELRYRKDAGMVPDSPSPRSYHNPNSPLDDAADTRQDANTSPLDGAADTRQDANTSPLDGAAYTGQDASTSSSTNKRKFEAEDESSTQSSKSFKQDSSDITSATEPFSFGDGDD